MDLKLRHDKVLASVKKTLERDENALLKWKEKGRLTARERFALLFDRQSFTEVGALIQTGDSPDYQSVLTGYGTVGGRPVFAWAQDFSYFSGMMGETQAKKIAALYDMAKRAGAPVVAFFDSAGANVREGIAFSSAYGAVLSKMAQSKGEITQIALICGACGGVAALLAELCDFTVVEQDRGTLSLTPPSVLKQRGGEDGAGSADDAAGRGYAALVRRGEPEAVRALRQLLNFLPSRVGEGTLTADEEDDINRQFCAMDAITDTDEIDVIRFIAELSDRSDYIELYSGYEAANDIRVGFLLLSGIVTAFIANDYRVNGGSLSCDGLNKAARFLEYIRRFRIPVINLVNTNGFSAENEARGDALLRAAGGMVALRAGFPAPSITLYIGKAFGSAPYVMGTKELGADLVFALPWAQVSLMRPDSAVRFLWGDRLKKESREALEEEWITTEASPLRAARAGQIDMIIESGQTRQRLISALQSLHAASE